MIKILVAGDLCLQDRTAQADLEMLIQSHSSCMSYIKNADYSIVNLECSVGSSAISIPIKKAGLAIKCTKKVVELVKALGFRACTLANNHFADYGEKDVINSLNIIASHDIDYVGAGTDIDSARKILYKTIGEKTIAVINACEHEFTIATEVKAGCNPLNVVKLSYDIKDAKSKADYIVVVVHGGHEEYQLPSPRMQETYRFFVDMGADVIVNHHQHCFSGYEIYKDRPIFYGIGNFSFDEDGLRNASWNEGYMVVLNLGDEISFELIPYIQNNEQIGVHVLTDRSDFEKQILHFNELIATPARLKSNWDDMVEARREEYLKPLRPYQYSMFKKIAKYKLLPKRLLEKVLPEYLTLERMLFLKSYFQCESHRDIMNKLLQQ